MRYIVRGGCAFVLADGTRAEGGQEVELEDDIALIHADKIEPARQDQAVDLDRALVED